jgi:hypothetical protein
MVHVTGHEGGNGAREAVQRTVSHWNMKQVDYFLMHLWEHGYKVVPLVVPDDHDIKPARVERQSLHHEHVQGHPSSLKPPHKDETGW